MGSFTIFGRRVRHPAMKALTIVFTALFLLILLSLSPVILPLHFFLRRRGRNGFWFDQRLVVGRESFQRRREFRG